MYYLLTEIKFEVALITLLVADAVAAGLSDGSITTICGMIVVVVTQLAVSFALWVKLRENSIIASASKTASDTAAHRADTAADKAEIAATSAAVAAVKADRTSLKIDEVAKTTDTIHQLTNSGMTEVREELKAARAEIKELQQIRFEQAIATAPPKTQNI